MDASLTTSTIQLKVESGMTFEEAVRDLALKENRRIINFLTVGRFSTGKSALINGLIGEEVAPEGMTLNQQTKEVKKYYRNIDAILFNIWDSPGIETNQSEAMVMIAKEVKEADLLLFCIKMNEMRLRKHDVDTIAHFTMVFSNEVWQHTVFALTFANKVLPLEGENDPYIRKQFFDDCLQQWRQELRAALRSAGVDHETVERVPILPIGYHKKPSLPNGEKNWLTTFWSKCFQAMKEQAQPALLKVNLNRLKSMTEVESGEYYRPLSQQPIIFEVIRKTLIPVTTGTVVGGILGLFISGPFGMAIGGAIGTVTGIVAATKCMPSYRS